MNGLFRPGLDQVRYNSAMPLHVSDKQLDEVENGNEPAVIVRSDRTKKGYAVIPQKIYDELRPLVQFVMMRLEAPPASETENERDLLWTPEKNAR